MNRNEVVPGAEKATFIFEELDAYTRQACLAIHCCTPEVGANFQRFTMAAL